MENTLVKLKTANHTDKELGQDQSKNTLLSKSNTLENGKMINGTDKGLGQEQMEHLLNVSGKMVK